MPTTLNNHGIGTRVFVRDCHALHGKDEDSKNQLMQASTAYQVRIVSAYLDKHSPCLIRCSSQ